jgi:hypothetical protein
LSVLGGTHLIRFDSAAMLVTFTLISYTPFT